MDAAIAWLSTEAPKWLAAARGAGIELFTTELPDSLALIIALISLFVSLSAFLRTARDSSVRRKANSRAAIDVARELLPPLADFLRSPRSTEARAVVELRGRWRDLERFAAMAGRRTRTDAQKAVAALNAWERAWRDYNYNPHTEARHLTAKAAAESARDLLEALATRHDGAFLLRRRSRRAAAAEGR
jgi:hypothetical protein